MAETTIEEVEGDSDSSEDEDGVGITVEDEDEYAADGSAAFRPTQSLRERVGDGSMPMRSSPPRVKNAFFGKCSGLTPILLMRPPDPKRCPKRPQAPPWPLNIHLRSHKTCFEPVSAHHVTMGCVRPHARAHIGPCRLESMPGHPLGPANTRAGLWGPATTRGAVPKSGLPHFHQLIIKRCAHDRGRNVH